MCFRDMKYSFSFILRQGTGWKRAISSQKLHTILEGSELIGDQPQKKPQKNQKPNKKKKDPKPSRNMK